MSLRFDAVVRERFLWYLLMSKKELCTVIVNDAGIYILVTGKMGAVVDIGLGVVGDLSKRTYRKELAQAEAGINTETLGDLVQKRHNVLILHDSVTSIEMKIPKNMERRRQYSPDIGPTVTIQASGKKHKLIFRTRTEEDVRPLLEMLQPSD